MIGRCRREDVSVVLFVWHFQSRNATITEIGGVSIVERLKTSVFPELPFVTCDNFERFFSDGFTLHL